MRRSIGWRALLGVLFITGMLTFGIGEASADNVQHGIGFTKGCTSPTKIGDPYACSFTVRNVLDEAQDTLTINGLIDVVHTAGGDVGAGNNLLGSVQITTTTTPTGATQSGSTCAAAMGTGTAGNPYVGVTSCTLPFGSRINVLSFSHYTVQPGDFALPLHQLKDDAKVSWHDLCDDPGGTGNSNCNSDPPDVGAASLSVIQQLGSSTTTDIHNAANQIVTTVAAGSTVHDFVTVNGQGGQPAPTGNVTVDWFLNGGCTGAPAVNSGSVGPLVAGAGSSSTFDAIAFAFTPNSAGFRAFRAHYLGDARYAGSDGPCEPLRIVDADIQITPDGVNHVGQTHTFTAHVNTNDGNGSTAALGALVTFTIDSGPGTLSNGNVSATSCSTNASGNCTIDLTSAVTGITTVSAHTTVLVSSVSLTRNTNGAGANSGAATKRWVDAKIAITPDATN